MELTFIIVTCSGVLQIRDKSEQRVLFSIDTCADIPLEDARQIFLDAVMSQILAFEDR